MNGYNIAMIQPNMWQALIQPGGKVKMAIVAHYGIAGEHGSCPVWKCKGKVFFSSENQHGNR
jgi:arginine/ornithine N-succinyltransferase beta subunit